MVMTLMQLREGTDSRLLLTNTAEIQRCSGISYRLGLDLSLHDNKVTIFLLPSLVVFPPQQSSTPVSYGNSPFYHMLNY
jgi:hypothetical protein